MNTANKFDSEMYKLLYQLTPMPVIIFERFSENDELAPLFNCNEAVVKMFNLSGKHEFLSKYHDLSPKCQPDGSDSRITMEEKIKEVFDNRETLVFEWTYQKLSGEIIQAEITLVNAAIENKEFVLCYVNDITELKDKLTRLKEADERVQIMLDATPMCCNFWDENYRNIDCNQEAVNLFELKNKQEYLDRFNELSPEYQPDGMLSATKALGKIKQAFETGYARFEWMHKKLNGELVPAEITLIRVKHGDKFIVTGYTLDLRELKKTIASLEHLEKLAFTDSLTGAFNRRYFLQAAKDGMNRITAYLEPFSLIMLDIDWLKKINDTYGHIVGDEVLKNIVELTQSVLRSGDTLSRFGGEEFLAMIPKADLEAAVKLAGRIRNRIMSHQFEIMSYKFHVTVSLGVTCCNDNTLTVDELIARADKALYAAKNNGRNKVEFI